MRHHSHMQLVGGGGTAANPSTHLPQQLREAEALQLQVSKTMPWLGLLSFAWPRPLLPFLCLLGEEIFHVEPPQAPQHPSTPRPVPTSAGFSGICCPCHTQKERLDN